MKHFYIIPDTKSHHNIVEAETPEEAMATFAAGMDSDMSAYFKAVEAEPAIYPHGYTGPENKFERAMSIIVATMSGDTGSRYYAKDRLKGVKLTNMDAIAKLQAAYDAIHPMSSNVAKSTQGRFYRILSAMTRFSFSRNDIFDGMHGQTDKESDSKKIRLIISSIDWDYPGKEEGKECPSELPSEVVIEDEEVLDRLNEAADLAGYLSDTYGYCLYGFSTDIEEVD